ncbi:hypothetical protein BT96DRAFT_1002251 [Gymnopus androsaceus JB14]|uniref:DNA topoisomerase (ATP-hydrolyzing) n=1 Tax=Gymnopus androsaceus JB14 TaxID=1447944 RepID=A0A6A4GXE1_9AGAR|nr:hypothetical protein BT96DRAFT_1002251 [Gymnopus androsaceus JB14]
MWTCEATTERMIYRDVQYVPGFFKIVDEILLDAAYNKLTPSTTATMMIRSVVATVITVLNLPKFFLASSLSRLPITPLFKYTYKQTWTDNTSTCRNAEITKNVNREEYKRITIRSNLTRFGMDSIDEDSSESASTTWSFVRGVVSQLDISPRWEVPFTVSKGDFMQVSLSSTPFLHLKADHRHDTFMNSKKPDRKEGKNHTIDLQKFALEWPKSYVKARRA